MYVRVFLKGVCGRVRDRKKEKEIERKGGRKGDGEGNVG